MSEVSLDLLLNGLLVISIIASIVLILVAAATLGRKLADWEYQILAGINGVRRIQSRINVRTHFNRVMLGLVYLTVTILALTDIWIEWRVWIGRALFVMLIVEYTISSLLDWFDERAQLRIELREEKQGGTASARGDGFPKRESGSPEDIQPSLSGSLDAGHGSEMAP